MGLNGQKFEIALPPKLVDVFTPKRGDLRYRGAYGGRGSGKSFSFALMSAVYGYAEKLRILCTREFQNSIKESFHAEVKNAIQSTPWLSSFYDVGVDYIRGSNGTEYIFKGLRHNMSSVKSMSQIDICILEESEDVPAQSWEILEPTVRAPKSEIWVLWNPKDVNSPVDERFRQNIPPRSKIIELNWRDNPAFPMELDEQRKHALKIMSPEKYNWIWEGDYYEVSEAQIFAGKYKISEFDPKFNWDGPYCGLDFGFSSDPTAAIKCWIYGDDLYIEHEAGMVGLEIDHTANFVSEKIEGFGENKIIADSSRPESISYLRRNSFPYIEGSVKGKGSVEDGIEHIKSFGNIFVHPRCGETINELKRYSYVIDRNTGQPTTRIEDKNNHYIDALRYALEPVMHNKSMCGWVGLA